MTKVITQFAVVFRNMKHSTEDRPEGEIAATWDRFNSHNEALRAIYDCDLMIPADWNWNIEKYEVVLKGVTK